MKPTGSKDKFAIRRNALTFLTIACNGFENDIDLSEIIEFCSSLVIEHNDKLKDQTKEIKEFMTGRYQAVLHQDTPIVQAATGAGSDLPVTVRKRAQTIEKLLEDKEIAELAQLYKRGCNILKKQGEIQGTVDSALFEQDEEKALFEATEKVYEEIVSLSDNLDIALKIITLKPVLDLFFDAVFVMSENESVKFNRMKLIRRVTDLVTQNIGDISYLNI
jgi:glycyl-tRNA synthetase beta chain